MSTAKRAALTSRYLTRKPRIWLLVVIGVVVGAIGVARQGVSPRDKALDAVGGEEALMAFGGLSIQSRRRFLRA